MSVRRFAASMLMLMTFSACTFAQEASPAKLPATAAGRRVAGFLKAFNAGEDAMRTFYSENVPADALKQRPIEARLDAYREMRGNLGSLEARRVISADETSVKILIRGTTDEWREMTFLFTEDAEHKLQGIRVEDAERPRDGEPPTNAAPIVRLSASELPKQATDYLGGLSKSDDFSGVVMIAHGLDVVFQGAYGLADKTFGVANRENTKFNLGSMCKAFTQIAIGQLIEQGKLHLGDHLGDFLPDYPNKDAAQKVTVRELLDMSSGIGDFFGPEFAATPKDKIRTLRDYLPFFAGKALEFEPGTNHRYSNGGYVVLGLVVEKVAGQDYFSYVRDHIFQPAGMRDTDWSAVDDPVSDRAEGYTRESAQAAGSKGRGSNVYFLPARGSSAGGGYSTAPDLLKFSFALQSGQLRIPDFGQYGKAPVSGFPGIGIAGGSPGVNAALEIDPRNGYTIIVLSNYDPPSAEKVTRQLREWIENLQP